MPDRRQRRFPNAKFLPWLLLYALVVAYSSTIVGPAGMNYVPMESDAAWQAYLIRAFTWVDTGSDQRADWMGNLSMLVPMGFLLTACLAPRRGAGPFTFLVALLIASAFVLGVKYAQLFFPPRTVTLNYVVAQVSGAAIGIGLFAGAHGRLVRLAWRRAGGSRETLRNILILYATGVFGFLLMPLDFALSLDDLAARFEQVPGLLFVMPGAGRPPIVQATVSVASAIAMIPFGVLMVLAPRGRNRLFSHAMLHGLGWLTLIFCLTALVLSGTPALVSFLTRIAGLAIGVRVMPWVIRQDPIRLRQWLAFMALWAVPPYLILLAAVNGLASTHWLSTGEAIANVYIRGLLPLFDYYIVTKAEAAKNIAAHIVMYAPIGLLVWVRGHRPGVALGWGALLALSVETGRFMRPGLQGDLNAVAVAGLTALLTAQLMAGVWRLLEGITLPTLVRATVQGPGWRERAAAARLREATVRVVSRPEADRL
jgi:glycopeptide antibiotics resistance protein